MMDLQTWDISQGGKQMRFIETVRKFFRKKPTNSVSDDDPYNEKFLLTILSSNDYAMYNIPHKKVVLCNPQDAKITGIGLLSIWRGTGHVEWEALLAYLFIQHLKKAENHNLREVEITDMFSYDLNASKNRKMTAEQVNKFLSKNFEVVEETAEEVRVQFKYA